ncbi:hypothetical protein NLI96_g142 [Meripilus lineatus]|uniref:F-box domain-containing protein n=1 Tax=Meripilus lineatus TaxID=2056292 RepID=A0AAD5VII7_9APHY|nr:hypothetical protein NLI96_g142 [Physisporinus lineatus]
MSTTHCALPQEITDYFLDYLHDNRETLRNCVLVSQSWAESARYHIYHDFVVHATKHEDGIDEFVDFLQAHPSVHRHIRNLKIAAPSYGFESAVSVDGIKSVLVYLDDLRTLSLEGLSFFERAPNVTVETTTPNLKHSHAQFKLRRLTLTRIFWPHPLRPSILGVLDLFSQIDELRLSRFEYSTMINAHLPESGNSPSLRAKSLNLEFPFFDLGLPVVKALLHVLHFPSLESLTVACFAMSQASTAGRLISKVGGHLRHFTLDLRTLFSAGPYGTYSISPTKKSDIPI